MLAPINASVSSLGVLSSTQIQNLFSFVSTLNTHVFVLSTVLGTGNTLIKIYIYILIPDLTFYVLVRETDQR